MASSIRCISRRSSVDLLEEKLPVLIGQEAEESDDGLQQDLRIPAVQVRPRQKVSANHLKAGAAGFVCFQHQACSFQRLLNDGDLASVDLEIDDFVRFRVPPPSAFFPPLARTLSSALTALLCTQGCTIEVLAIVGEDVISWLRQAPFAAGPETV